MLRTLSSRNCRSRNRSNSCCSSSCGFTTGGTGSSSSIYSSILQQQSLSLQYSRILPLKRQYRYQSTTILQSSCRSILSSTNHHHHHRHHHQCCFSCSSSSSSSSKLCNTTTSTLTHQQHLPLLPPSSSSSSSSSSFALTLPKTTMNRTTLLRSYSTSSMYNQSYNNNTISNQKMVFVSKHNSSLHITQNDVIEYCTLHGIIQNDNNKEYRCTNSHVIIKNCPNCQNINDNSTNQYKLYISAAASAAASGTTTNNTNTTTTNGAYFCHRCGWKGSWFDFKHTIQQMKGNAIGHGMGTTSSFITSSGGGTTTTSSSSSYGGGGVVNSSNIATRYASTSTSAAATPRSSSIYESSSSSSSTTTHGIKMIPSKKQHTNNNVPPLPMPPPKLQAIYSTALLDGVMSGGINNNNKSETTAEPIQDAKDSNKSSTTNNKVLDYLVNVRGLNIATLRKYGVGRATYSFANKDNNWVATECVTFPWIVTVSDAEIQESYRGSKFIWDQQEIIQQQLYEQEQLYRASSYATVLPSTDNDNDNDDNDNDEQEDNDIDEIVDLSQQTTLDSSASISSNNGKVDLGTNSTITSTTTIASSTSSSSSCSIAVDGDSDKQIGNSNTTTKKMNKGNTIMSMKKKPPTLQDIKNETFITRRIKVRSIDKKEWQRMDPPGGGWGLFGYHTIPKPVSDNDTDNTNASNSSSTNSSSRHHGQQRMEREIIITEGEYDAMAVWQATHRPSISLPNGCRSLPVEVLPLLEDFTKIYLWMDNDAAGQEGAELFAKKLGLQRCYIVKPTYTNCRKLVPPTTSTNEKNVNNKKEQSIYQHPYDNDTIKQLPKDANDALRQGLDLSMILDDAQLVRHDRLIQFSDLRNDVLHEIMHPDQYVGHPVASLPNFTSIIKGFRRGELTVLTGPTGSGKTTFLGQLSVDLVEQDVNVLWGSFEIKNIRLIHKLMQQFAREPLPAGDPTMRSKLEALSDRFDRLPFTFLKFHGGTDVEDVLDAMDYAVYVNDVEHIILDNMQFMVSLNSLKGRGGSAFDKFDVQDMAIEKFRKFATDRNVHIVLVVHPKKEAENSNLSISSIYGTAKATQEADTVLILQNDGRRKFIEVKKNRFNGTLGHTPLHFDRQSCRYTETPPVNVSGGSSGNSSPTMSSSSSSPSYNNNNNQSSSPQATSGQRYYSSNKKSNQDQPTVEGKDWFVDYIQDNTKTN